MRALWHRIFGHPALHVWHTADPHIFLCNLCNTEFSPCAVGSHYTNLTPSRGRTTSGGGGRSDE